MARVATTDATIRGGDRPFRAVPPHRSRRAELLHRAPALGHDVCSSVRVTGVERDLVETSGRENGPEYAAPRAVLMDLISTQYVCRFPLAATRIRLRNIRTTSCPGH